MSATKFDSQDPGTPALEAIQTGADGTAVLGISDGNGVRGVGVWPEMNEAAAMITNAERMTSLLIKPINYSYPQSNWLRETANLIQPASHPVRSGARP